MASQSLAFMELFWELMNRKTGELGRVDYKPQKPPFDLVSPLQQPFPRSTPEAQGVESEKLSRMMSELLSSENVNLHQLFIVRNGHVILEHAFGAYRPGIWHITYSMCKSFTGMAIGLLHDEGKLNVNDRVLSFFEDSNTPQAILARLRYRDLTIRHLLTMSTGVSFNEVGAISGNDWVKSYFESSAKFPFGTQFDYNSMNSFILSAIVSRITGKTMFDYLKEKLFAPMGITKVFWESSPTGITKAGWGMFLTPEDAAKLGKLYLDHGMWNGKQLISREWVEESTKPQIATGRDDNPFYGYQLWIGNLPGSFMYNGMLGQNVYIYPSLNTIAVVNAGNTEVFANGTMTQILRSYLTEDFGADHPLPENPAGVRNLTRIAASTDEKKRIPIIRSGGWGRPPRVSTAGFDAIYRLNGRVYEMRSKGIGLFPLIMQVVHYNYTDGIRYLRFLCRHDSYTLEFLEGDEVFRIPVGYGESRHTSITMHGEEYLIGSKGRFGWNEDGKLVLSLEISYIEEACRRMLKIECSSENHLVLKWNEAPGNKIIEGTLEMITTGSGNTSAFVEGMLSRVSPSLIHETRYSAIHPVVDADYVLTDDTSKLEDLALFHEQKKKAEEDAARGRTGRS